MEKKLVKSTEVKRPAWLRNLFNFRLFSGAQPKISPHAVIDPTAEISEDVEIGPFCVIGPEVKIASGCRLLNSVTILGKTTLGRDNILFPNSVLGTAPQDKKYKGQPTYLEIGIANVFREAVTIHCGTEKGGGVTRIGDDNLFMVTSHVGHDCTVGSHCVITNDVLLAGHVHIGDNVNIMGGVGIHQFVTVGDCAFIGGYARIHHDVPPFVKVDGEDEIRGLNKIGLSRAGFSADDIAELDAACRKLFLHRKPLSKAMAEFDSMNTLNPLVKRLVDSLRDRDQGRHGRAREGHRSRDAKTPPSADTAPVAPDTADTAPIVLEAADTTPVVPDAADTAPREAPPHVVNRPSKPPATV
jgi:UDP-N-acetylglucosamine acyltransferase